MTLRNIGRRFLLLGAGGASLALPTLTSLLPRARAQATGPKRFVAMMMDHGGVWPGDMFPSDSVASMRLTDSAVPHAFHAGSLLRTVTGGQASLSPSLSASSSLLTDALVGKMNVIRGLDAPFRPGHRWGILGNYGPLSGQGGPADAIDQATIDQVMAYSPAFYPTTPRKRSIYVGTPGLSVTWTDPGTRSGPVQVVPTANRTDTLFESIYSPPTSSMSPRESAMARMHESYSRLLSPGSVAGRRLGAEDRARLAEYADRVRDIDAARRATTSDLCLDVTAPTEVGLRGDADFRTSPRAWQLFNDVVVAAFMCDTSRIAVYYPTASMNHTTAHEAAGDSDACNRADATTVLGWSQAFFENVFLDLVAKLDAVAESPGATLLDGTLAFMSHMSGAATHLGDSIPVITAGGAGSALSTGRYVDFRNRGVLSTRFSDRYLRNSSINPAAAEANEGRAVGVSYFQWLTTCLDVMGVERAEWQTGPSPSFTPMAPSDGVWLNDPDTAERNCNNSLPVLT